MKRYELLSLLTALILAGHTSANETDVRFALKTAKLIFKEARETDPND